MRRSFQLVAALAALAGSPVMAQSQRTASAQPQAVAADAQAPALAHAIVDIAFPPERRAEMMDKLMRSMGEQMKSALPPALMSDPGLARIMTDYLAQIPTTLRPATTAFIPKQMDAVAQAYARMFTLAELRDIVAFARTPSGKSYLQRSMDVMSDPAVAAVNSQYFAQAQTLTQASASALGEKVSAYLKAHPDVAKSLQAQTGGAPTD